MRLWGVRAGPIQVPSYPRADLGSLQDGFITSECRSRSWDVRGYGLIHLSLPEESISLSR